MKAWQRHKGKIIAAAVVAAMLFGNTLTYLLYAEDIMPRTGLRSLADFGLLRDREYVIVEPDTWAAMSEGQRAVLLVELTRYLPTVYFSVDKVPERLIHFEPVTQRDRDRYEEYKRRGDVSAGIMDRLRRQIEAGRRIVGFKKGMRIGWKLDWSGPFVMKCSSSHWVSGTGAEGRSDVYVWVLGWWVRVYNVHHAMA